MTERANIPSPHIPSSVACGQWETLLADALDGLLKPEEEATFNAHMATCAACTALYGEARRGREWLEFLAPEPEVPAGLMDRILAVTGPGQAAELGLAAEGDVLPLPQMAVPAWQKPGFMGFVRRFAEPRLMMTAAMAFFSIALTLNMTGVRLSTLRLSDLRPIAVRSFMERQLTMASVPIVRYYDHLRFVYEVESKMRQLRETTEGENGGGDGTGNGSGSGTGGGQNHAQPAAPGESKQTAPHKDGGSRVDPPQEPASPATENYGDSVEASLVYRNLTAHSGGSVMATRERSTKWIA